MSRYDAQISVPVTVEMHNELRALARHLEESGYSALVRRWLRASIKEVVRDMPPTDRIHYKVKLQDEQVKI